MRAAKGSYSFPLRPCSGLPFSRQTRGPLLIFLLFLSSFANAEIYSGASFSKYQHNQFQVIAEGEHEFIELTTFKNYMGDTVYGAYYGYIYKYNHFQLMPKIGLMYGHRKHYKECDPIHTRHYVEIECETYTTAMTYRRVTFSGMPSINFKFDNVNLSFGIIHRSAIISINYQQ